jgi:hypothetical protein
MSPKVQFRVDDDLFERMQQTIEDSFELENESQLGRAALRSYVHKEGEFSESG